jgi:L-alanine-DL-glutamate epimerase-like enolase superfamily enzyme
MLKAPYYSAVPIEDVQVAAFRIPTDLPESDGTFAWQATTLVVVELRSVGHRGLGFTYASAATARLISDTLADVLIGADSFHVAGLWSAMFNRLRNQGDSGLVACAISAIDCALWDLKARLLGLPLVELLGSVHLRLPAYGSGGFTSYDDHQLGDQFSSWAEQGIRHFKMKVGREPPTDLHRVRFARRVIGDDAELFVDGNGAYTPRQAIATAASFANEADIRWLEQPLPPGDPDALRFVRDHLPATVELADGEYAYTPAEFRRLLEAGAVDVVMADVTRCGGITGFLKAAALCEAWHLPMSSHCAPTLHAHVGGAVEQMRHVEYFHDHVRIEQMLFEGAHLLSDGHLTPDRTRPGLGLEFKWSDAARYAA